MNKEMNMCQLDALSVKDMEIVAFVTEQERILTKKDAMLAMVLVFANCAWEGGRFNFSCPYF